MKLLLIQIMLVCILTTGCCRIKQRVEPQYPSEVSGWKVREGRGFKIVGNFVIMKGNLIDNGKIQIKLVDVIPPDPCAEVADMQARARARIQFIRSSDQKVLCDDIYPENGAAGFSALGCRSSDSDITALSEFGISGIYTQAINIKEGWVFFELRN
jgi:hypothetical protein